MLHHQEKYLPKITFSPCNYQLRDHSCYPFIILNKTFNILPSHSKEVHTWRVLQYYKLHVADIN